MGVRRTDASGAFRQIVQVYDPQTNHWKAFDVTRPNKFALPAPTTLATAAVADGIAFLESGGNATGLLNSNQALFVLPSIP